MPFLEDFLSRRFSPPAPRFQRPPSTPFNSTSDAFELHPDIIALNDGPSTLRVLCVFVEDNVGGGDVTNVTKIVLQGHPVQTTNMSDLKSC